jgi:uroporphyrinogen-III synthase
MSKTLEIRIRVTRQKLSRSASQALTHIGRYDWILFTSKNAVTFFAQEFRRRHSTLPLAARIAAVGPETARALRTAGFPVHIIPKRFTVRDMLKAIGNVKGLRILFPRSAIAPHAAIRALRRRGARVSVVPLYTATAMPLSHVVKRGLLAGSYAQLTFKSPSGVHGLLRQLNSREKQVVRKIPVQCIGPTTVRTARTAGFREVSLTEVL